MKLTKRRKLSIGIAALLFLLIITNPSITAFKAYRGADSYEGLSRSSNLFILSDYRDYSDEYIGFLGNFWRINQADDEAAVNGYVTDSITRKKHQIKMTDSVKKLITLYTNLLKEGYNKQNLGTLDEFGVALSNPNTATKIYYNLEKDGYTAKNLGTLEEFKKTFCNYNN